MPRTQAGTPLPCAKGLADDLNLLTRFYSSAVVVPGCDCLEWNGAKGPNGYGKFHCAGKTMLAHRLSVAIKHRRWPGKWFVRHTCNNRACINPEHLLIGTRSQNERDKRRPKRKNTRPWHVMYSAVNITRRASRCEKGK